jgi:hypothetical protein
MPDLLFRWRGYLALWLVTSGGFAAEFSGRLTPEEFAAAGLAKLSPTELTRLDALVRTHTEPSREGAREGSGPAGFTKADEAAERPRGLRERLRVVLTPGTQIDYRALETEMGEPFRGYRPGQILKLANGQRWRVVDGKYWSPPKSADQPRKVVVRPGVLGSFFLEIEDGGRPKVVYVDTVE